MWRVRGIAAGLVVITATGSAVAGPPPTSTGPVPTPHAHGFMLYLSTPLGPGAGANGLRPKFGLRIEQVRMAGNSGAPDAGDPMQHRGLIGWQMEDLRHFSASGMKIVIGNHDVTYDIAHRSFGPLRWRGNTGPRQTSTMSRISAPMPVTGLLDEQTAAARNFAPSFLTESRNIAHESSPDSAESAAMMHDVAATAVSTLKLSRPGSPQRPAFSGQRPLSMPLRGESH